jgi:carboxymethylenebutenolidase
MCFDTDSRPPIQPIAGAAVDGKRIHLKASDGTEFSAFHAAPESPNGAAILILPDVRGLYRFYEELALRFAEAGVEALTIDYFGRTAGKVTDGSRADNFDHMAHMDQVTWPSLLADMQAGANFLHARPGVRGLFTTGFCFGGRLGFIAGTRPELELSGATGFYGWPASGAGRGGVPSPIDDADKFTCPVLGLFGEADRGIPASVVDEFDQALTTAHIEHELISYPGAPHSFFDRKAAEFQDASEDAWRRLLEFIAGNTPHERAAAA